MMSKFQQKKVDRENERKKFIAAGGRIISKHPKYPPHISPAHAKTLEEAKKAGMAQLRSIADLKPLSEPSQNAVSHVEYVNREKAYEKRGGCIFHAHHLPKWANDDPKKFFQAADRYEGVGHRRYVEIEFALPNELTPLSNIARLLILS